MSEDLMQLVDRYKRRGKQAIFYFLAFFAVNILTWVLVISLTSADDLSRFTTILFVCPAVFIFSLMFLFVVYRARKDSAKTTLTSRINQELIGWKREAIESAIKEIMSEEFIPLERIETYSHKLLDEKLAFEFHQFSLYKFNIVYHDTIQTLNQLLDLKPYLGTYYPVEQQFKKTYDNEKKEVV